jgi:hypothetical protein
LQRIVLPAIPAEGMPATQVNKAIIGLCANPTDTMPFLNLVFFVCVAIALKEFVLILKEFLFASVKVPATVAEEHNTPIEADV